MLIAIEASDMVERRKRAPKGRKFWMTAMLLGVPFASCTFALFSGRMTDVTYVGFLQVTIPLGLASFHVANVAQKVGMVRAGASAQVAPTSTP